MGKNIFHLHFFTSLFVPAFFPLTSLHKFLESAFVNITRFLNEGSFPQNYSDEGWEDISVSIHIVISNNFSPNIISFALGAHLHSIFSIQVFTVALEKLLVSTNLWYCYMANAALSFLCSLWECLEVWVRDYETWYYLRFPVMYSCRITSLHWVLSMLLDLF